MFSAGKIGRNFPGAAGVAAIKGAPTMFEIKESAGQVIASDTQDSIEAINQAIVACARLCGSIVEVSRAANLPAVAGQPALTKASTGLSALVEGRKDMTGAARDLLKVQKASSLDAVSFGCPDGFPPMNSSSSYMTDFNERSAS